MKEEKVIIKDHEVSVHANGGNYYPHIDLLCDVKDTGNGFIAHFPSYLSTKQDNYVCLDYSEAALLVKALRKYKKANK